MTGWTLKQIILLIAIAAALQILGKYFF